MPRPYTYAAIYSRLLHEVAVDGEGDLEGVSAVAPVVDIGVGGADEGGDVVEVVGVAAVDGDGDGWLPRQGVGAPVNLEVHLSPRPPSLKGWGSDSIWGFAPSPTRALPETRRGRCPLAPIPCGKGEDSYLG